MSCLTEEQLLEIYYDELPQSEMKQHLSQCALCQRAFSRICNELMDLDMTVPDGGHRAVSEALAIVNRGNSADSNSEIMTIEEVAAWLKVDYHNICNMLHLLPHTIIDGNVRFEKARLVKHLFGGKTGAEMKAPDQPRQKIISLVGRRAG